MSQSRFRSRLAVAITAPILATTLAVVGTPIASFGASALPVVLSFNATKTSVPNAGGKLTLHAKLRYAASCYIKVSQRVHGFPKTFSCSSDNVTQAVTLPANRGENPITYTFEMNVKNKAGSTRATNVVVTEGAAPPPISFTTPTGSPTTLVFAAEGVFVGDDPLIVTVHNNSSKTQIITAVTITPVGDPNDFLLNRNNCGYVTSHANCSLAVQFQPTGAGARTGVIDIFDSSWGTAGTNAPLKLAGTGVWASATVANANIKNNVLRFPAQGVGSPSAYQYVTLSNTTDVPLYLSAIGATGGEAADFDSGAAPIVTDCPTIVSVGQSCTFGVSFDPSGSGVRTTNIVIDDNTLGTQTQLQVLGSGVYSSTTLAINGDTPEQSPLSYNFGSAGEGGTQATLTIKNTSSVTLHFDGATTSGIDPNDFAVAATGTCVDAGVELAAGQSCNVQISFTPQASGTRSATLHIADSSPDGGEIINVSGTGT